MNKKVSLREIVGTKIVYAVILTMYYWMWARTEWQDRYLTIQSVLGGILIIFFLVQRMRVRKYRQEGVDEMAERNLQRCDSLCLKIFIVGMIGVAWSCAIFGHLDVVKTETIGWLIIGSILLLSIIRTLMFVIMDSRGV